MKQILKEMIDEILQLGGCVIDTEDIERIVLEYYDKILAIMPKPLSIENATYSNEASYMNGWNACLNNINNN